MNKVSMVMFDLSGTTVFDDTGVRDCLYKAAVEFDLKTTPDEILLNMGTNKIHLYQFLISKSQGKNLSIEDFEKLNNVRPNAFYVHILKELTTIEYLYCAGV